MAYQTHFPCGEYRGSAKIEGLAKETAEEIAAKLKLKFQQLGWIQ